ncbi:chorismate-binding protein [Vaginella massiliensis]|uniref:chorismate-binding protein n=1 Tax=Vaginella massiliensis TaxID=1816680 RepID=UPI0037526465
MSEILENELNKALKQHQKFVLFSKPNEDFFEFWADHSTSSTNTFVLHSFDDTITQCIKTDEIVCIKSSDLEDFRYDLRFEDSSEHDSISYEDYLELINKTTKVLQNSDLKKVVISRTKQVNHTGLNIWKLLFKLKQNYPNAFVYFYYDRAEAWFGATPELLLHKQGDRLQTVSLAGTKSKDATWTNKEYAEQQTVTDFIVQQLSGFGEITEDGPNTVDAGLFHHLKSYISCKLEEEIDLDKILSLLHPTPAVGGFPKELAKQYILQNEAYDRQFYAGYLGYKRGEEEHYFVNLRCAKMYHDRIKLFVGGGIMPDSVPENEWEETEMKSNTLCKVIYST